VAAFHRNREKTVTDIVDFINHPQVKVLTEMLREENVPAFVAADSSEANINSVGN
jgi:hypothetical protein